jgi:hypothetical protein
MVLDLPANMVLINHIASSIVTLDKLRIVSINSASTESLIALLQQAFLTVASPFGKGSAKPQWRLNAGQVESHDPCAAKSTGHVCFDF